MLLESVFLHEGHIASCGSSFFRGPSPLSVTGVESTDVDARDGVSSVKLTGISCFRLYSGGQLVRRQVRKFTHAIWWLGLPPRHVVWSLTSFNEVGGPPDVYVGVKEGNQKSGSLCLSESACSRSI